MAVLNKLSLKLVASEVLAARGASALYLERGSGLREPITGGNRRYLHNSPAHNADEDSILYSTVPYIINVGDYVAMKNMLDTGRHPCFIFLHVC